MVWPVPTIAVSLTVVYAAIAGIISEQTTSGNVGINSGEASNPGDVDCPEDTGEAFCMLKFFLHILVLAVLWRTLCFAAILLGWTAMAVFVWARGLMVRPGRYFQLVVIL